MGAAVVHLFVAGLYASAPARNVEPPWKPPATNNQPSPEVAPTNTERPVLIGAAADQPATGSYRSAVAVTDEADPSVAPPATITFPFAKSAATCHARAELITPADLQRLLAGS